MRMASRMRVTPRPVISPVSTGWSKLVWTKDWAARLNTSSGPVLLEDVDHRHLVEQVAGRRR